MSALLAFIAVAATAPYSAPVQTPASQAFTLQPPLLYVVAGGDYAELKRQGIEKLKTNREIIELGASNKYEAVERDGLVYLLHHSIAAPPHQGDVAMLMNLARDRKMPAVFRGTDAPDIEKALRNLHRNTRFRGEDPQGAKRPASELVMQIGISIQAQLSSGGRTWHLRSSAENLPRGDWPAGDDARRTQSDEEAEAFEVNIALSPRIPGLIGTSFAKQALELAQNLQEEKVKPLLQLERDILLETYKGSGSTGWISKQAMATEELPTDISDRLILAMQSTPEFHKNHEEAEALFRAGKLQSFKIGIYFTIGMRKSVGSSRFSLSLRALMK